MQRFHSTQHEHPGGHPVLAAVVLLFCAGCLVLRQVDYVLPGLRVDSPPNIPLPCAEDENVQDAIAAWKMSARHEPARYPTAYHVYADSPAPGTFEGDLVVGLAFSGGGTRGQVFGAACYRALEPLFLQRDGADGVREYNITAETDYIAGVSTGALPAALLALDFGGQCPPDRQTGAWPEALNVNLQARFLRHLGMRPWLIARDHLIETNSRPACIAVMRKVFFQDADGRGLVFGDLPPAPALFLCSTRLGNPSGPFIQTRLPYRYSLDFPPEPPWAAPVLQTFENTHADPLRASLAEACYNSISYPGLMRSGLMRVHDDPAWVATDLDPPERKRMLRAREGLPSGAVIELKDGGLIDNRAVFVIGDIFASLVRKNAVEHPPLLISIDASILDLQPLRPAAPGRTGWMGEMGASYLALWQASHRANAQLMQHHAHESGYHLVCLELAAWIPCLSPGTEQEQADAKHLTALCAEEPLINSVERFTELMRSMGTSLGALSPEQMAAAQVAARFAVWKSMEGLRQWATHRDGKGAAIITRP